MKLKFIKKKFIEYCQKNKFDKNKNQIKIVDSLINFYDQKNSLFKYFLKKNKKLGFYLYGNVGVGKTMILNFFYKNLKISKQRFHFNEFMIMFHDFRHNNKENSITKFVKKIKKKSKLIYFDEFQVTNIVDAMILGKLFEVIFKEKMIIIVSSNIKIDDLYKDGLQRSQFMSFIKLIKEFTIEKKLMINDDYRKSKSKKDKRFFYPINEKSNFKINQLFRKITKDKKCEQKIIFVKGRKFIIKNLFEAVARFDFKDLCEVNIGSEEYIGLSKICNHVVIDNVPKFDNYNANAQQRFIILIDILYEKKISLTVSSNSLLEKFSSSQMLNIPFKRTLSRIHELTSKKIV